MLASNRLFVLTLKPIVADINSIRALCATLKFAVRRFGLKTIDAREIPNPCSPEDFPTRLIHEDRKKELEAAK